MLFRVAQELGKTVAWIERNMSSRELSEWFEFFELQAEYRDPTRSMDEKQTAFAKAFGIEDG